MQEYKGASPAMGFESEADAAHAAAVARRAGFMWAAEFGDAGVLRVRLSDRCDAGWRYMTIAEAMLARLVPAREG